MEIKKIKTEYAVLGSGAGGATVAYELAKRGKNVLILEKGSIVPKIGFETAAANFYDRYGQLKSKEGVIIYRTLMAGGTTIVSCGNGVRSLEKELNKFKIDIKQELDEAERDLDVKPLSSKLMGDGTNRILEASKSLGYNFSPMPKFIDFEKCASCGKCTLGCIPRAKWTALNYIEKAQEFGAKFITGFTLDKIKIFDKKAVGMEGKTKEFIFDVSAEKVILATGALETPKILNKIGIDAGNSLFCDLFTVIYGITKDVGLSREPTMSLVNHDFLEKEGFILSPFLDPPISMTISDHRYLKMALARDKVLGLMIKIKDESKGYVTQNTVSKKITGQDKSRLEKGVSISKDILLQAGVNPKSLLALKPRGAHPGGSAAIGTIVDINQETKIKNLFVSDASVLPEAPGLPPILTIIALSKRLAKHLCQ
jgi:choline dehydrogenase-like flavoprotein